jgi:hypothetical protein
VSGVYGERFSPLPLDLTLRLMQLHSGKSPFHGFSGFAVMRKVTSGERPARPKHADADCLALPSDATWSLIESCWAEDRASRPCIGEVVRSLVPPPPPLCALVIGINKYRDSGKDLRTSGCVADADDMYQYLTETRGMLPDSIMRLNDEAATRAKILEGIRALRDSNAPRGDPIIIFWAGLSALGRAPPGWNTSSLDGKIQMLIPHDFDLKGKDEGTSGLLDYQFNRELAELAEKRGDNIVSDVDLPRIHLLT